MAANSDQPIEPDTGAPYDPLFADVDLVCDIALGSINVDGAAVAILTGSSRMRDLIYATDATAQRLDELQFILGEGPYLDAAIGNSPHLWADLNAVGVPGAQWPAFAREACEVGAQALFTFPIPGAGRPIGALEFHRRTPGALTADETQCAATVARVLGTLLLSNWRRYQSAAVNTDAAALVAAEISGDSRPFSRTAIHIAAGIVAVQLDVSPSEGLDRLRAYCYAHQCSPHAVAADIIAHRLKLDEHRDDKTL